MNGYARLGDIKRDIAGVSGTDLFDDSLVNLSEVVSRECDRETGRHFYTAVDTREYSGDGSTRLYLTDDLQSASSVSVDLDGDGVYETAVTGYWLWPDNAGGGSPYRAIELHPASSPITAWPSGRRNVRLVGTFGHSEEWQATGLTVNDEGGDLQAADTSVTVSASATGAIYRGDTVQVGTEQMEVTGVASLTLTVVRGVNGTTAAIHTNGAAISVRRYPRDIEEAVKERVIGIRWDAQGGYESVASLVGDPSGAASNSQIRAMYARWRRMMVLYHSPSGVI